MCGWVLGIYCSLPASKEDYFLVLNSNRLTMIILLWLLRLLIQYHSIPLHAWSIHLSMWTLILIERIWSQTFFDFFGLNFGIFLQIPQSFFRVITSHWVPKFVHAEPTSVPGWLSQCKAVSLIWSQCVFFQYLLCKKLWLRLLHCNELLPCQLVLNLACVFV